eukprot:13626057-Alexandrium_andersonii.AAC.1
MRRENKLSARDTCTIAFWAHHAGATGMQELSYNPASSSGNFQKHLDRVLKESAAEERMYTLNIPIYRKADAARAVVPMK